MKKNKNSDGVSLIELIVVVTTFAVVGILVVRAVSLALQGTKKTTSLVHVRENMDYSLSVIERQIRNASSIIDCTNSNTSAISYSDQDGIPTSFSCINTGFDGSYVASGSAVLTSDTVKVTSCSFICTAQAGANPSNVSVNLTLQDIAASGISGGTISSSAQIYLRNY